MPRQPSLSAYEFDDDDDDGVNEGDLDPTWDVEGYVRGLHDEIDEILGPDAGVRLAVALQEVPHIVQMMHFAHGKEGVQYATKELRDTIDQAERNAMMSNRPMRRDGEQ